MEFYQNKKGFTLIEVLVVVGIISTFLGLLFYFWNTMDVFRKSRDSKRINDLNLIDSVLKTLLATETTVNLGEENVIYISLPDTTSTCSAYNLPQIFSPYSYRCQTANNYLKIDGNGWIPVNFTLGKILNLTVLPVDPLNNKDYFYSYQVKGGRYKLTARLESPSNIFKMATDNGFEPTLYETGSNLFIPSPQGGLVGYWSFDEATATIAIDYSGNNNNGTMYSSTTATNLHTSSGCKIGSCANFDGVDDYVEIGQGAGLDVQQNTISSWIKFNDTSSEWRFVYRGSGNYGLYLGNPPNTGYITYGFIDNAGINYSVTSVSNYNDNKLHFIVGTYDGSAVKLYVDGVLIGSTPSTSTIYYQTLAFTIGRNANEANQYWLGLIDEVRIYNRALSAEEIKAIYEKTK